VSGIRGPGGGYKLSDEPENITIAQIINAINSDVEQKETSERKDEVIWSTFSAKLCNYLETVTLGSLITENSSVNMSESAQTESMIEDVIEDVIEEVMVNRV
jgi:Rrf2 family iron-sulfur cluster assembly transcriptional regulator